MKAVERGVVGNSIIFFYNASDHAKNLFFYILCHGHFYCNHDYQINRSDFDSYLLIYIKKGELVLDIDSQRQRIGEGHLAFINCYKPHKYFADSDCEIYWLHFDGSLANRYYDSIKASGGSMIFSINPLAAEQLFSVLERPSSMAPIAYEAIISKQISSVLLELVVQRNDDTSNRAGSLIDGIKDFVADHLSEDLTVELLAKRSAVSESYLMRNFKLKTGMTLHAYIMEARLGMAKYLLKTTDLSLKEIAALTGFRSESYFNTSFKGRFLQSPNQYRKSGN
jgi:AraC-like DNA-binding protein